MTLCPTCKKSASKEGNKLFPFCSERCHLIDLGRWLNEEYRVPEEPESSGGAAPSSSPQTEDES
jgi:endogenous inhibitor of DNA gyrase (YacG/DUF329 family)